MREIVYPMALVASGWLAFFGICFGIGQLVLRLFRVRYRDDYGAIVVFWVGWGTLIAILQLWHLAFRIDARAFVVVAVVAGIGLTLDARTLLSDCYRFVIRKRLLSLAIVLVIAILANRSMQRLMDYDSGLYHIQALRWVQEYPIITGLANLHGRFGFNNANFLYVALVGVGPWQGIELNIANSLLILVIVIQVLIGLDNVIRHHSSWKLQHLFSVLMVIPILDYIVYRPYISSPNSDLAAGMLLITLMALVLDFLTRQHFTGSQAVVQLAFITFFATLATIIKLSSAVFSVALVALTASIWLYYNRHQSRRLVKVLAMLGVVAGVLLIPWMIRGVLLSGYPLYPATIGAAPVDWRVPESDAESEARWIRSWPRLPRHHPDEVLGNWDWLSPWLADQRTIPSAYLPAILVGISATLLALRFVVNREALSSPGLTWMFLIPAYIAVSVWFFTAPNTRFAISLIWGTAISSLLISLTTFNRSWPSLMIALLIAAAVTKELIPSGVPLRLHAGPNRGFYPIQSVEVETYETESGLVLFRPTTGDQCWDSPLPCTPYPNPLLQLRGDRLSSGFKRSDPE